MSHAFSNSDAPSDVETLYGLIRRALGPGATPMDLARVRKRRAEIQALLSEAGIDGLLAGADAAGQLRLAAFYAALGGSESSALSGEQEELLRARADDARAIGTAFADVLVVDLPERLTDFRIVFAGCPPVGDEVSTRLVAHPSVAAAGGCADGLVVFGLTPSTVAGSMRALRNLAKRWSRQSGVAPGEPFMLGKPDAHDGADGPGVLPGDLATRELAWTTRLSPETTAALYAWLCELACYRPALLEGFRAEGTPDGLRLRWTGERQPDLNSRWTSEPRDPQARI